MTYKKNYNLIFKNVDLFNKFHHIAVSNIKYDQALKDIIKILIKLYENYLKDISSNPNSQIHLNFNEQEFPSDIHAMMFEEENNEKSNHNDNDVKTSLFVFKAINETLTAFCEDFVRNVQESHKNKKSHNKSLGVKKFAQLEYIKSVIEIIVYGIASCLDLDVHLNELISILVKTTIFDSVIDNFFEYEWNNMYQKLFEQIFNLIIYKTTPHELIENVT